MSQPLKRSHRIDSHDDLVSNKRRQFSGDNILQDSNTKLENSTNILNGLISPPITPDKQRVISIDENYLSPRKLFATPPSTPTRQFSKLSIYSKGKALFQRGSVPTLSSSSHTGLCSLPSRELEAEKLSQYLLERITNLQSGSLYISGPPGTGKTAQTTTTMKDFIRKYSSSSAIDDEYQCIHDLQIGNKHRRVACIQLNCMIINRPENIYHEICRKMLKNNTRAHKYDSKDLKETLSNGKIADISIVLLDELDNLITGNQQILFELFSYASNLNNLPNSPKLILVGIANALDLTDRFLPRLRTNCINPTVLQFLPYSSDQIKNVIESKLRSISENNELSLIHPAAIQLCSKKTAANTGDLRKAFDICHKSLELIEELTRLKLSREEFANLNLTNAPKASIANVAKVCSTVFNAVNFSSDGGKKLKNLNLQQKTVICSLVKFEQETSNKLKTKNEFYEFYRTKVKLDNLIGVLKKGEFLEVITTLESFGIINSTSGMTKKNVELGTDKISGNVRKDDLMKAITDVALLKKLITDDL